MDVTYPPSFALSSDCVIDYTIVNHADRVIKMVKAGDTVDLDLKITSPNGDILTPYPYPKGHHTLCDIQTMKRDEKQKLYVRIAPFYPLLMAGEYRCVLTRKVWAGEAPPPLSCGQFDQGREIMIPSPELRFRIEEIDSSYVAPWVAAHPDAVDTPPPSSSSQTPPLPTSATITVTSTETDAASAKVEREPMSVHWLAWAVVISSAIGLLWLALKKHK